MALDENNLNIFSDIFRPGPNVENTKELILARSVAIILFVAGAASIIYLLIGAFHYATAGGDEDKANTARKTIIFAIIGLIIIMSVGYIFHAATKLFATPEGSSLQVNL